MAYRGVQTPTIKLGLQGLMRDDSQDKIPPTAVIDCLNITMRDGLIEKEPGSRRINPESIPGGIKAFYEWEPAPRIIRTLIISGEGRTYYFEEPNIQYEILPVDGAPETIVVTSQPHILECGAETPGREKKLFIFSGSKVQVIEGTNTTRRDLSQPDTDWSGQNQPSFGFLYRGRVIAFGNQNFSSGLYISDDDNNEDFVGSDTFLSNVFPGEGSGLKTAFTYKGRPFFVKSPRGLYYLDDSAGPTPDLWVIRKSISDFGAASAHSANEIMDDCLISNSTNGLTSLSATLNFGEVRQGDVLNNLRNESYVREYMADDGIVSRWNLYYENRKQLLMAYRSKNSQVNDYICTLDFSNMSAPKVLWRNNVQANCLGSRRDVTGIPRPYYGSDDGYLYNLEEMNRNVNGQGYMGMFQTPHMDFGFVDAAVAESNKIFQFLEVVYEPTGRWNIFVDVFIDGKYSQTVPFNCSYGPVLDDFELDTDALSSRAQRSIRKPIAGTGRRISFKFYNQEPDQNFKITGIKVDFKLSGNAQKAARD